MLTSCGGGEDVFPYRFYVRPFQWFALCLTETDPVPGSGPGFPEHHPFLDLTLPVTQKDPRHPLYSKDPFGCDVV